MQTILSSYGKHMKDPAGEVVYHTMGTKNPMYFMVKSSNKGKDTVKIHLLGEFKTKFHPKISELSHDWHERYIEGINFVIAGKEGEFVSSIAPVQWMQRLLPEIGHVTLRDIVIPRSHHAGMWKVKEIDFVGATYGNTIMQLEDLEFQLTEGGARVLDVRPHRRQPMWTKASILTELPWTTASIHRSSRIWLLL